MGGSRVHDEGVGDDPCCVEPESFDVKNGNAGAIERVAAITLEEIEETSPFAAGRLCNPEWNPCRSRKMTAKGTAARR